MRNKKWWLTLICLSLLSGLAVADDTQQLLESAQAAYNAGEYRHCAEQYAAVIKQGVESQSILYNAACCWALNGNKDDAFEYLFKAVELGYHKTTWLEQDSDLESLRDDPRWPDLISKSMAAEEIYLNSINRELYEMYQVDQGDRLTDSLDWSVINQHDAHHRARAHQMLDSGLVVTADDYFHAAMIFQHGDDSTDYLLARQLALKSVELDSTKSIAKWLSAAAHDRYLWEVGKPQWYGTQYHLIDNKWTIEPIDTTAVTDDDRLRCQVPPLAEARRKAEEMNRQNDN